MAARRKTKKQAIVKIRFELKGCQKSIDGFDAADGLTDVGAQRLARQLGRRDAYEHAIKLIKDIEELV